MTKRQLTNQQDLSQKAVFALDIGTRSIIGVVGVRENDKMNILAIEKAEHSKRTMVDGQIEDIDQVASIAAQVKKKLEERLNIRLERVCVAAAGRALKTQRSSYVMELPQVGTIDEETISQLEAGAISMAEEAFDTDEESNEGFRRYYLVGYTVTQYYLDNYMMSSLKDHRGKKIQVDIIATFLPSEVVESLYTAMKKTGLEVASMTLEPIAAINAAIPENLRLLNLVLVDIGAGTSDIAACRDGSIIGYTMATVAGDEITENLMKEYLVDFQTAEWIKMELETQEEIHFKDVLGMEQVITRSQVMECVQEVAARLCREISEKIMEVNGGKPSAVFLAGGGSRLSGLREGIVEQLEMNPQRVAIAGNNFQICAYSDTYDLNNPEYATPLGIVISAGLNLINDSFLVKLNGSKAKLFRSGIFTIRDILMMNGYGYQDMIGKAGTGVTVTVNGKRTVFYGSQPEPAQLKLNETEGKLSDIVHAGDSILFVPARHGEAAKPMLRDIEGIGRGLEVMVNGAEVSMDTLLKNGDVISYLEPEAVMPEPALQEPEETVAEPADLTRQGRTSRLQPKPSDREPAQEGAGQPEKAKEAVEAGREFWVKLNGKDVSFPEKKDKSPYCLMDMLEHSGIDFDNIRGQIILKVNQMPGNFQQVLSEGDIVDIYEKLS